MRSYVVIRHVVTTLAVMLLLFGPLSTGGPPSLQKLLFWSALASAIYVYHRLRSRKHLPMFDNLNVSVVAILAASVVVFQVVGLLWILIW